MSALEPPVQLDYNRVAPLYTVYSQPFDYHTALASPLLDLLNVRYLVTHLSTDVDAPAPRTPFTTSWIVPSPPTATTRSRPSAAARAATSSAWPPRVVTRRSTSRRRSSRSRIHGRSLAALPEPAAGLTMITGASATRPIVRLASSGAGR